MMKAFISAVAFIAVLGGFAACSQQVSSTQITPTPCVGPAIALGEITDKPGPVIDDVTPLAQYVAQNLGSYGIRCGKVEVAETVTGMIEKIKNGEVDIYFDSMFPASLVSEATGAQPILRRWRECDPDYYSVIFTTPESSIATIEDLPGHVIAMDRPDSTSGFVLPSVYLIEQGLDLIIVDTFDATIADDQVGVYFSYDDDNTHELMLSGKVDAGATDDFHLDKWEEESPGQLEKLGTTDSTLRQAVLVRGDMDSDMQAEIKKIFLNAPLEVIEPVVSTCKYDDVFGQLEAAFDRMLEMRAVVQGIPGWLEAFQPCTDNPAACETP